MGNYSMSSGKSFEPLPEDKYTVEVFDAETYMGTKYRSTEEELRVKFTFVILDEDKTMTEDGAEVPVRGRRLWARTTTKFSQPGSSKPTKLTKLVAAVIGHEPTQEEADSFDEKTLIGKQLCVMVDAKPGEDGTIWNNVLSFSKATKQLPKFDELDAAENKKTAVKKSQPVTDTTDFEADMDKLAAEKAKK